MARDESLAGGPAGVAGVAGVEEWLELVDEALRGLNHALNNRIGSLSAFVELHQMGDLEIGQDDAGASFKSLSADLARLEDCNRMVRLLPAEASSEEEPLILDDVLADVLAIHRFLHESRDLSVTIVPTRYVEPVRAPRWALVRVLTLLLRDAKRVAKPNEAPVRAVSESDEQWVRVDFRVAGADAAPAASKIDYAASLAGTFGGTVSREPGMATLRLPTLKARRSADRQSP